MRRIFPNGYKIRHLYSSQVLESWQTTKDPLRKHLKDFGRSIAMQRKKKRLPVKTSVRIQTGLRWLKNALLESGRCQFYGILNDARNKQL